MSAPRFVADGGDVLARDHPGTLCSCYYNETACWLADVLNQADARGALPPLPTAQAEKLLRLKAAIREGLDSGTSERTIDQIMKAVETALLEEALERWNDPLAAALQRGVRMQADLLEKSAEALGVQPQALADTLAALHTTSPWGGLNFLISEDATLGASPIAALRAGRIAEVIAAASRYIEHGAP